MSKMQSISLYVTLLYKAYIIKINIYRLNSKIIENVIFDKDPISESQMSDITKENPRENLYCEDYPICFAEIDEYKIEAYRCQNCVSSTHYFVHWIIESTERIHDAQTKIGDNYILSSKCEDNTLVRRLIDYLSNDRLPVRTVSQKIYRKNLVDMLLQLSRLHEIKE